MHLGLILRLEHRLGNNISFKHSPTRYVRIWPRTKSSRNRYSLHACSYMYPQKGGKKSRDIVPLSSTHSDPAENSIYNCRSNLGQKYAVLRPGEPA